MNYFFQKQIVSAKLYMANIVKVEKLSKMKQGKRVTENVHQAHPTRSHSPYTLPTFNTQNKEVYIF